MNAHASRRSHGPSAVPPTPLPAPEIANKVPSVIGDISG